MVLNDNHFDKKHKFHPKHSSQFIGHALQPVPSKTNPFRQAKQVKILVGSQIVQVDIH
jgi:hypothetical protein